MHSARLSLFRSSVRQAKAYMSSPHMNMHMEAAGCQPEDLILLQRQEPWLATDRMAVKRALDGVLTAGFAIAGVARFTLTGEYVAAVISQMVAQTNWNVCCIYAGTEAVDGLQLATADGDDIPSRQPVTPERLFALTLIAGDIGDDMTHVRSQEDEQERGRDEPR